MDQGKLRAQYQITRQRQDVLEEQICGFLFLRILDLSENVAHLIVLEKRSARRMCLEK